MLRVLVACVLVVVVAARRSPHADYIEQLMQTNNARYSNDIFEDALLDVPDLIRKYRYPIEVHTVTTDDGYILEMQRIPHGRDRNNVPDPNKPTVFVMHGMLASAADWVLLGPGSGLAYILAEEGFDVWLGNARGTHYSRKHLTLNPDATFNTRFWEFSWEEIGYYDLPAMIDHVLEITGKKALHYIGHSQGTTSFWCMGSLRPDYNDKIISMHALAPVAYMEFNQNRLLNAISPYANEIERIAMFIGIGEFLPNSDVFTWAGKNFCMDEVVFQPICTSIVFLIGGWNEDQFNATMWPVKMGHTPAGISVRQLAHYGQSISTNFFRRFDYGTVRNLVKYGRSNPPDYDVSKITAPVFLHYSSSDPFADVRDVDRLFRRLGRPVGKFLVSQRTFSHVDFMWGIDAKTLVYDRVINLIKSMDNTV